MRPTRRTLLSALVAVFVLSLTQPLLAALPAGFTDTLVTSVGMPTAIAFTPDGRLLITRQTGSLRVFQSGSLLATPAISFGSNCTNSERGLLGVAVDPAFVTNHRIYLFYSFGQPGSVNCKNRVSRFILADNNVIDPTTELVLLDNMNSFAGNHNGGDLHFGKDGYLYVSIGDGGCDYANTDSCGGSNNASRDENMLLGKILRITGDGGIPPSNPFQGVSTARCNTTGGTTPELKCQETFAWGLRNPFRFGFDPNAAGSRFFINDVGQGAWEEIDLGQSAADYGWNCLEGRHTNDTTGPCLPTPADMTGPIFEYSHSTNVPGTSVSGCSAITGGAFVPNGLWPGYDGAYMFADYVCNAIFKLADSGASGNASSFATSLGSAGPVAVIFGPFGSSQALYYTTNAGGGQVRRITYNVSGNNPPTARVSGSPLSGLAPLTVNLSASGSSDPNAGDTLTYFWNFGDGTPETSTASLTIQHTYAAGNFTTRLRARDNNFAFSPPVTLQVQAGNQDGPSSFFTIVPCRAVDTRSSGGPATAGASRVFGLTGTCGIPATATAVAVNVTVVPSATGYLAFYRGDELVGLASTISFQSGINRANNAILPLGAAGDVAVFCGVPSGTVHLIIDVVGYFE